MVVTQLAKWGNSQGIRIPKEILKDLNYSLEEIDNHEVKFEVTVENGEIILKPKKERTMLDKLFENFNEDPKDYKVSIEWDESKGQEVW